LPDTSLDYAGLALKNPVIAASAGTTATVDRMRRAEDAGAAAVAVKSLFENPIPRRGNPTPHMRVIRPSRDGGLFTLYSYEQAAHLNEYGYADLIRSAKAAIDIPVIANIDCASPEAWASYARLVEQAGADAVEVKSCPHGEHLMSGDELAAAVRHVKSLVRIPVIAKLPGQLTNPYRTALDIAASGADALVMFNRFSGLDIDVETCRPVMHGGFAGHGGPWSIYYRLRWIAQVTPDIGVPICGTGGVMRGEDVAKYILAGAHCVEVATAIITQGYRAIGRILRELESWMERGGHASLDEVRGLAARHVAGIAQISRAQTVRAWIDDCRCNSCGLCYRVCIYRGVDVPDESGHPYQINGDCRGCGLCAELCPAAALTMVSLAVRDPDTQGVR